MDSTFLHIPPFTIAINYQGKTYNFSVTQVSLNRSMEVFEVKGLHSTKRIQTMRPYFRNNGSKTDKFNVHIYPGTPVKSKEALELVIAELRRVISQFENDS